MADPQISDPELSSSSSDDEMDLDNVEIEQNPLAVSPTPPENGSANSEQNQTEYPASPPASPVTESEPAALVRTPSTVTPVKRKVGRPRGPNFKPRSPPTDKILSETDDTIVLLRNRAKPVKKKTIVLYREDLAPDLDVPVEVQVRSRKKGRPPKLSTIVEQVNEEEQVVIDRTPAPKEPTQAELKKLELQQRLLETEAIAGRPLRLTKKGKVDGRMKKGQRSEAQIAATKKLVESNKIKRELARREKEAKQKEAIDESVKTMVGSLAQAQAAKKKEAQEAKAKAKAEAEAAEAAKQPPAPTGPDLSIFG